MNHCNHIIGIGEQDYHEAVVHADDSANDFGMGEFCGYSFCPLCGEDVRELASAFKSKMDAHEEEFWQGYKAQHGEDEYERARFKRGPLHEKRMMEEAEKTKKIIERWEKEKEKRDRPPKFSSLLEKKIIDGTESYEWPRKTP